MTSPSGLHLSPTVQRLPLSESVLRALGWSALEAHTAASPAHWSPIIEELRREDCGHSWRSYLVQQDSRLQRGQGELDAALVAQLQARTQAHRPTALYVYLAATESGGQVPVAMAAISERVSRDFPHSGFPVLARCFIRPRFRRQGLYPFLVRHRVELCRSHWGDELRCIHMGSASPTVSEALGGLPGFPDGFRRVGEERLVVAGRDYTVSDLVALTPSYRQQLQDALRERLVSDPALLSVTARFLERGAEAVSYGELMSAWESARVTPPRPLQQLFDLFEGIGLIR